MFSFASLVTLSLVVWILHKYYDFTITQSKLKSIPTIGSSGFISSYISSWRFVANGHQMIQEGYNKFYGTAFKIATLPKWLIVVSGPQMIEDIRRARDDQLSFREAIADTLQTDYMFRPEHRKDSYHVDVIRTPLTRNLGARFSDIKDEITEAFNELLPVTPGWTSVPLFNTLVPIVCRTSNRLFVGLPLCRNPEYRIAQENFTLQIVAGANIINIFPSFLKPLVGRLLTKVPKTMRTVQKYLFPIIQERLDNEEKLGPNWQGKPNDLISWLLESAQPTQRTPYDVTFRIIVVNFAAIHTSSMTLTNVLYDLGVHPEYIAPLRKEVDSVITAQGWSKESMGKMTKLDSFIKESTRMAGLGSLIMGRKVLKDFTFSNGITVPAGMTLAVANHAMHHDESHYKDANNFKGFRFADMRDNAEGDLENLKHQMVSLDLDYLVFGHGRHACPGRFFAVNEIKAMLAYILMNYDMKLSGDGTRPIGRWFAGQYSPNRSAHVLFRKRQL